METIESVKAALIALELKDGASMPEIRGQYIELTSQAKFRGVIISDEKLKKEFLKYQVAYITLIKHYSREEFDSEFDMGYYPADQVFHLQLNQGIYHVLNQNYIKASEKFQQAFKIDGRNITVLLYMGLLLLKRKNYYAAVKYFNDAARIDSNCEDAWFYLGECYFKAGEFKKALPMYETAKNLNPGLTEIAPRLKEINEKLAAKARVKKAPGESLLAKILKKLSGG
jgi:tetratricopeptide (TPR) repeat protein